MCISSYACLPDICIMVLGAKSCIYDKAHALCCQVPIAVKGRIVNWIDSKATFGDSRSHL